eukprot:COSAG06_NODE_24670_length_652_cov_0.761221_2_plen_26_part_01
MLFIIADDRHGHAALDLASLPARDAL